MKLKTTISMSTRDKWINNGMLFGNKKEWNTDTCNMDDLEIIILTERSQSQKTNIEWFRLYEMPRVGKAVETERLVVAKCWGEGRTGSNC